MSSSNLFKPLKLGKVELQNRIVLAPLTRFRADAAHVPLPFVPEYYAQRGSVPGTLLITEATFIAPKAGGYGNAPGIYSEEQIASWKKVTDAVHARGSFIYLQLWALGRAADPGQLKKELGQDAEVKSSGNVPFEGGATPTPLTEEEIKEYIGLYAQAAKNSIEAGFDGVEIHGANGYLVDQFTQDNSNNRTDAWGGSVEKRARFGIEVAKAVVEAVGADRTGIRLSPFSTFQGMKMKDPKPQFSYLAQELKKLKLAYIHVVESRISGNADVETTEKIDFLLDLWDNQSPVLIAGGFKQDSARRAADEEYKDKNVLVVFGRYFISNPDLVFRVEKGIDFTPYDREKFYNKGQKEGYITWPFSKEFEAQAPKL
ncbi:Chanoclavine-I aldehyde reductase fgaOx3 [Cadophora gregata f. sp. sojae]|nr:Chanoclavine-I aldehyde reductase fgaOx3 [Cadophora gregata f. sp. sojae]